MGMRHAENLRRHVPRAELVAIADVALDRARGAADELEIQHAFGSLEAMLDCKDVQAVVIATPDKFHSATVQATAKAGKDIFCEKPLGLSLFEASAMLEEVEKAGVRLQVGFMRRYDPAYAAAKRRIDAGEIGIPVIFKSLGSDKDGPPLSAYHSNVNGMLFYTNTIHDFDLARWLMGDEVSEVHAFTTVAIRPEVARFGDVVASVVNLRFGQGAIGNIESHAQALYGYDVRTEIVGSKASIMIGNVAGTQAALLGANGSLQPTADHFLTRFADAYITEMRDFVDSMLEDRAPRISGEDGLKALAIAVAAENSYIAGKPIQVSERTPISAV